MSEADYRRRVTAIYQHYAPDKLKAVDNSLLKYKGQEEDLIAALVSRYGPEPPSQGGGANAPGGSPSFHPPGPPPASTHGQGAFPSAGLQSQQSVAFDNYGIFGSPQQSMVFTPNVDANMMLAAAQAQNQPQDEFAAVRKLVRDTQFLNPEHERMWEEAWVGKIPLGTIRKYASGDQVALLDDWGFKRSSHPKSLKKFQKRYFLLLPYFLYYFENNDANSACKGALYLDGATVKETDIDGKTCIEISSRVQHKPTSVDPDGIYDSFKIYFESQRTQAKWLQILQEMTKVKAPAATAGPSGAPGLQRTQSMMVPPGSPGGLLLQQPGSFAFQPGGNTPPLPGTGSVSPAQNVAPAGPSSTLARGSTPPIPLAAPPSQQQQAPPGTILVSEDNVKNRIRRLVKEDRNPTTVIDTLTEFICKMVCGQQEVWELMEDIEVIDRGYQRPTVPLPQTNETAMAEIAELRAINASLQKKLDEQTVLINRLLTEGNAGVFRQGSAAGTEVAASPPPAATANTSVMASSFQSPTPSAVVRRNPSVELPAPAPLALDPDSGWAVRMSRIQARKQLVEQMLNDLPSTKSK